MNLLMYSLASTGWRDLVHALLHSLWIGVAWAAVLAMGLRLCGARANLRYGISLLALCGLVISTVAAWALSKVEWNKAESSLTAKRPTASVSYGEVHAVSATSPVASPREFKGEFGAETAAPWIAVAAIAWLVGMTAKLARLGWQVIDGRRTVRDSATGMDERHVAILRELKDLLSIRRPVQLAASAAVAVPCIFGIFPPVILLPSATIASLTAEQVRAILAHELAHIRRHDFLVNIFQQVLEAVLFFNPAVWWINRQIRLEREVCCDELALRVAPEKGVYTKTLLEIAESLHQATLLTPAFPGRNEPSALMERLRRMVKPGYQPFVRLPWASFAMVMLLAALMLMTLWRGSQFAIAVAAEILTPEERIERIAELKGAHDPADGERNYTSEDGITVFGRVRTEDGMPLERWPAINVQSIRGGNRGTYYHASGINPKSDGTFEKRIEFGKLYLAIVSEDYAPIFAGPLNAEAGGSITNLDLVLKRGFRANIEVVDPANRPVAGAKLEGRFGHPAAFIPITRETDANGRVEIPNASDRPMTWKVSAEGFQHIEGRLVQLSPEGSARLTLQPSRAARGRVISQATRQAVAGAAIKLAYRGPEMRLVYPTGEGAPELARSDADGRFTLDALPEGLEHYLLVDADGYAPKLVPGVFAGQEIGVIELGPKLYIEGEVRGDLTEMLKETEPAILVGQPLWVGDNTHSHQARIPIQMSNGVARFRVENLRVGEVWLEAGGEEVKVQIEKPLTNLVIQAKKSVEQRSRRSVVIRFQMPDDVPDAQGILHGHYWTHSGSSAENFSLAITNNEVRFQMETPGWFSYEPSGLIGYWVREEHAVRVEPGTSEYVKELQPLGAGAIHGSVKDVDGSETGGVLITVVEVEPAPEKEFPGNLGRIGKNSANQHDLPTRYVAQPLPLGGKYQIVARKGRQVVESGVVRLSRETPIVEQDLQLYRGKSLSGQVVDEDGRAIPRARVSVQYEVPAGHAFGFSDLISDEEGRFTVEELNPELSGKYSLRIDKASYQPLQQEFDPNDEPIRAVLKAGRRISGRILDEASGEPLAGAEVYARVAAPKFGESSQFVDADAKTGSDGRFIFSRLQNREYLIGCRSASAENVPARAGDDEVVLKVKPFARTP